MDDIARSHIDGNVPPPDKFQPLLRRDLALYFRKSKAEKITVEPEMLRDGATQSGLSFPKFYVWARVMVGGRLREEGAVRLAAVERKRFDVTDYLSATAIRKRPASLEQVFPRPVAERIRQKLALPAATE
jgi:hypothetical protein